jgi:hypothetical protein
MNPFEERNARTGVVETVKDVKGVQSVQEIRTFVIERLSALRRTPCMWAYTREAYFAQIVLLVELVGATLTYKFFRVPGTCGVNVSALVEKVDDAWAHAQVDDAAILAGLELVP